MIEVLLAVVLFGGILAILGKIEIYNIEKSIKIIKDIRKQTQRIQAIEVASDWVRFIYEDCSIRLHQFVAFQQSGVPINSSGYHDAEYENYRRLLEQLRYEDVSSTHPLHQIRNYRLLYMNYELQWRNENIDSKAPILVKMMDSYDIVPDIIIGRFSAKKRRQINACE